MKLAVVSVPIAALAVIHRADALGLACVSLFNNHGWLQKEARSSGYRVTESDERARSVIDRLQYHQVVSGRPQNAQTSTPRARTSVEATFSPN